MAPTVHTLPSAQALEFGLAHRYTEELADLFGQGPIGRAGEDLEALVFRELGWLARCGSRFGRRAVGGGDARELRRN